MGHTELNVSDWKEIVNALDDKIDSLSKLYDFPEIPEWIQAIRNVRMIAGKELAFAKGRN